MSEAAEILQRIAAGDRLAAEQSIDRYGPLVWSLAQRCAASRSGAEDVVQEVFIELWSSASGYDSDVASEAAFVSMIARRRLVDRLRSKEREPGTDGLDAAAEADRFLEAIRDEAHEPLPDSLRRKVLDSADDALGALATPRVVPHPSSLAAEPSRKSWFDSRRLGWYAAAAIFLVAILSFMRDLPGAANPERGRERLLASAADVIRFDWGVSEIAGYDGVVGDVVWSNTRQEGYMRFQGLPPNDPGHRQYQLWIVDPARDSRPVDGGVFDVPPGVDEAIIPIDAKLEIADPREFALTLEKPGGVVVSAGPVLAVAAVKSQ